MPEVRINQPQEAACKGCDGQRDAARDSRGLLALSPSVVRVDTFVPRHKLQYPLYVIMSDALLKHRFT